MNIGKSKNETQWSLRAQSEP